MRTLLIILLLGFASIAHAQNVPFEKENFPNDKDGFKLAIKNIKEGDRIFEEDRRAYFNLAIPFYTAAHEFNPDNAELNYKLGVCYLFSSQKRKSLPFLTKAYESDVNLDPYNIHYLLGWAHQLNSNWDVAIAEFEKQLKVLTESDGEQIEFQKVQKRLTESKHGKEFEKSPVRVWVDNLGSAINSAAPEYAPLISTDETLLIITARRESNEGGLKDESDNLPFEDVYYSRSSGGEWSPLKNIGKDVNTSGHDAGSGLSPDGKTLFVFRGDVKGGGDIYQSVYQNNEWSRPKALYKTINTDAHESAAALSFDGQSLFFISEKEGGFGGKDIYEAQWDVEKERWGEAKNLGPVVNSPYDEDGVYMHPDGKTLYFSSEGHNSIGGNDIFYSEYDDGRWKTPVNLGIPINTPDDDVFFSVAADGRTAYYSSDREEGYGEKDIYRLTFLGPEKQPVLNVEDRLIAGSNERKIEIPLQPAVEIRTSKMVLLMGLVLDDETEAPVAATIDLIDNSTAEVLASFQVEPSSGKYLVSLPAGKNYGLNVNADGYLFNSLNFNIPDSAGYREFYKVIKMKRIKIGETIVLRNIFYDYNKATIRDESTAELDRLEKVLVENPTIKVEISGHTDNVGGDDYNLNLSEQRAQSVVSHLQSNGIDPSRMIAKGYGESQPLATNDTPEGRQENRRTEFKIID
ncbi:OmpA family protein [Cryomorphaceae bacterium 1068]|nr:OmpA family protein [Cryomorphaceae bacterium 1068]